MTHRAEVVDLGTVGGVVIDEHEQLEFQARGGLELGQGHERAAVPSAATVGRSGRATAAPIAAPKPSPTA